MEICWVVFIAVVGLLLVTALIGWVGYLIKVSRRGAKGQRREELAEEDIDIFGVEFREEKPRFIEDLTNEEYIERRTFPSHISRFWRKNDW